MKRFAYAALCAAVIFLPTVASAQEVYHREVHQQHRITQGVENGSINKREYRSLERKEASLNAARRHDLRNGRLTSRERQQLNRRENSISRSIYHDKHN
ncbi:hypothetical protein [Nostoc sp.]|uniref:hypothetical protein n=1 Tax=Nostoc sp. TaxID=1180 RepID=UPI002FF67A4F